MNLEDCIDIFLHKITSSRKNPLNSWDYSFIKDIGAIISNGKCLSTAQAEVSLKVIKKHQRFLVKAGINENMLSDLLLNPTYRVPPYQSEKKPRIVRWLGDNQLVFKCSYNRTIVESIKQLSTQNQFIGSPAPKYNRRHMMWLVRVDEYNVEKVMDVIKRRGFKFDSDVEQYLLLALNAKENQEPSTIELVDDQIHVTVKCDDFLDSLLNDMITMEQANV